MGIQYQSITAAGATDLWLQSIENLRKTINQQRSHSFNDKINIIDCNAFQFPAFQRLASEIYMY